MKNILMILVLVAVALTSCDNDKQKLSTSFDNLQKESDSLQQVHAALKNHHNMHLASYATVTERMAGATLKDSTWLETLASQQVMLKNHEAEMQKVEQLFAGHSELKANFSSLTPEEMQAQIDAMSNDLDEIKKAQNSMSSDHEKLGNDLAKIEEDFTKDQTSSRENQ